jgi:hypothetical protein
MNDREFKHHLRDLVHGHHHPDEHDWESRPAAPEARRRRPKTAAKTRAAGRKSKSR